MAATFRSVAAVFKKDVRGHENSLMRGCSITSRAVSIPVSSRLARSDFRSTEILEHCKP